jgi:hypothetical protein
MVRITKYNGKYSLKRVRWEHSRFAHYELRHSQGLLSTDQVFFLDVVGDSSP